MKGLRRNAIANLSGRAVTAFLWIAATPFVLDRLGPERFGIWALFFAFNAYLLWLDLGVGSTMLRFVAAQRPAEDRDGLSQTIRRGLIASWFLGLVWAVAVYVLREWITQVFHVPPALTREAIESLTIFGLGLLLLFPTQALMAALKGFERFDSHNLCQAIGVVAQITLLWILLSMGMGLRGAAWAGVAGTVVSGGVAALLLQREMLGVSNAGSGSRPSWRELLHFSAALQVLGVLVMLQIQSGRLVVGVMGDLTMVTDYELSFRVAYALAGLPILIRDPIIPLVSRLWEQRDVREIGALFDAVSRWVFLSSAIILGLLWLLATDVARLWLGPGHEGIGDLIRLWVVASAANLAYAPGVAIARGMGMPRYEIMSYAAALVTNVGLAIAWVPGRETSGAVLALLVSYVVGFVAFVVTFHHGVRGFPFWPWLRNALVPRVLATAAAVGVTELLIAQPFLPAPLVTPGWAHGATAGLVFTLAFLAFSMLSGDTQDLLAALRLRVGTGVGRLKRKGP